MTNRSLYTSAQIIEQYHNVNERIKTACDSVSRDPDDVKLIVVSKTYSEESIVPLLDLGHNYFGENKVQEAESKWETLRERYPDINLHLIGHLQSNKAKKALEIFNTIHTLDSKKLLLEINKYITSPMVRCSKFLLEINMANEEQKFGLTIDELFDILSLVDEFPNINISGLMCIPPYEEEPSPFFMFLKKLADKYSLQDLSMGMSSDFEKAIQFGATYVRVGSEIFGHRQ